MEVLEFHKEEGPVSNTDRDRSSVGKFNENATKQVLVIGLRNEFHQLLNYTTCHDGL